MSTSSSAGRTRRGGHFGVGEKTSAIAAGMEWESGERPKVYLEKGERAKARLKQQQSKIHSDVRRIIDSVLPKEAAMRPLDALKVIVPVGGAVIGGTAGGLTGAQSKYRSSVSRPGGMSDDELVALQRIRNYEEDLKNRGPGTLQDLRDPLQDARRAWMGLRLQKQQIQKDHPIATAIGHGVQRAGFGALGGGLIPIAGVKFIGR